MKKFVKKFLAFLIIAFAAQYLAGIYLHHRRNVLVEETYYPVKRWKEFYQQKPNSIDMLLLGSSHCYSSCIPSVFDSILQVNSYNLGSSNQSLSTSYYVLKEALESQHPKIVLLEVYHATAQMEDNYANVLHNYPQMRTKHKYGLLQTLQPHQAINLALFPLKSVSIHRNQLIKNKKIYPDSTRLLTSMYDHKGYVCTRAKPDFAYQIESKKITLNKLNPEQLRYLDKISDLCSQNSIQLIIFTQPLQPIFYKNLENYDAIYNQIAEACQENEIPYFDFNQIVSIKSSNFYDSGHMLFPGSYQFSMIFAQSIYRQDQKKW